MFQDSLTYALSTLPENSLVGLVSFGRTVAVHDLSMDLIKHSYVFKGTKDITAKQLQVKITYRLLNRWLSERFLELGKRT